MKTVRLRFGPGDTVWGIRQVCLLGCDNGQIRVRAMSHPDENWWVQCPCCHGTGEHKDGPWIVERFEIFSIIANWGGYGEQGIQYSQIYGDYDIRTYPDSCVFSTEDAAEKESDKRTKNLGLVS